MAESIPLVPVDTVIGSTLVGVAVLLRRAENYQQFRKPSSAVSGAILQLRRMQSELETMRVTLGGLDG